MEGDRPLRRDLRLLGWELRQLVHRHGGEAVWDSLDELRDLAEGHLEPELESEDAIAEAITRIPLAQLAEMIRAMGLFFDLANVAEDRHRVRVLRQREREDRLGESFAAAARTLDNLPADQQRQTLEQLMIEPVLTAHPTEAKRRSTRRAIRRIRRDLHVMDRTDLLPAERRRQITRMRRDLASLWQTDAVSPRKPSVMEELRRTLFAARTMWRVTPRILSSLREAFDQPGLESPDALTPLRFGSWIGGDRDGNPNVTAQLTRQTIAYLRRTVVRLHRKQCRQVRHHLTISARRAGLPEDLKTRIEQACVDHPPLRAKIDRLHPEEWLVHWLTYVDYRLSCSEVLPTVGGDAFAYRDAKDLLADVEPITRALRQSGHEELLAGALQRWHDRIGAFGLHLLRLDIRINSTDLIAIVDELMKQVGLCDSYAWLDEPARRAVLSRWPRDPSKIAIDPAKLSEEVADRWALFHFIHDLCQSGGAAALGVLVVSMTHQPSDAIIPVWLMRLAAMAAGDENHAPLPVAPLYETIDDLDRSGQILHALLSDEAFRAHVAACDQRQVCMVGYSDSSKDGGYVASNWALYRSQEQLAQVARQHDVELTVFHGRGGAIGRGGGPAARAIHSLPPQAVDGRIRLTEQGEVIAERYDDPAIARRHLEQLFWATLTVKHEHGDRPDSARRALVNTLAQAAEATYRKLVGMDRFVEFQRNCTALPLIETLQIGSRPSRRRGVKTLEDLRAIPFTFAWNQVRMPINAFYGLGTAFESLDDSQREKIIALYRDWPWFRAVIDNAELALARCDPSITLRYVELAPDPESARQLCQALDDEFNRACRAVRAIKGEDQLLARVSWLRRTIRVRLPYLDILNLTQIELMRRRANVSGIAEAEAIEHALRGTVQAIAAGLRNTG